MTPTAVMRRQDKEITDPNELHHILDEARVVHLGMVDGGRPYVVPLNIAREGDELWLHCAAEGRKLRCLRADPSVCVEVERLIEVTSGPTACGAWTSHYESVIGFGSAEIVVDEDSRVAGLQAESTRNAQGFYEHFGFVAIDDGLFSRGGPGAAIEIVNL